MSGTEPKYPDAVVVAARTNGNAFAVVSAVAGALREQGAAEDEIEEFRTEAFSGDYDHLLQTAKRWVCFK